MLILLSPTKTLDFHSLEEDLEVSQPIYQKEATYLNNLLRNYDASEISQMMHISPSLATETVSRIHHFNECNNPHKCALFAFSGLVFNYMHPAQMNSKELKYAQEHLRIFSGLYGILKPLDLIQPYRLDIADKLYMNNDDNLYHFWKEKIVYTLRSDNSNNLIFNLMSEEYFKAIDKHFLKEINVITPVFKELRGDTFKTLATSAKMARGRMTRYIIEHEIEDPEKLKLFDMDGYQYAEEFSTSNKFVFLKNI